MFILICDQKSNSSSCVAPAAIMPRGHDLWSQIKLTAVRSSVIITLRFTGDQFGQMELV